jgi:hypothetical protein
MAHVGDAGSLKRNWENSNAMQLDIVSVNSFLDTFGPKFMRHPPRHIVAPVSNRATTSFTLVGRSRDFTL